MQHQFLLNNLDKSDVLQSSLIATGIKEQDIHFVTETNRDYAGHHVHEASIFEERDLLHSALRYGMLGFFVGILLSVVLYFTQPYGWQFNAVNAAFVLALTTGFGGWIGGLFGISHRNYRISRYENELKNGKAIMLVYTDDEHADKAKQIVQQTEAGSRYLGKDTTFDNPLKNQKLEELED